MKPRFRLFRRGKIFYAQDSETGAQKSLRTRDKHEANTLLNALNEAHRQPALNLQIARTYLQAADPESSKRDWQTVMNELAKTRSGSTRTRYEGAAKDAAFDSLRNVRLLETNAQHFLTVLEEGTVSTNVYLRRYHNFALGMNWLPWPILPLKRWPQVSYKDKRAITWEEHQRIVQREPNPITKDFYELCWHIGGSQSDVANLLAEDIDWEKRALLYRRQKTGAVVQIQFGEHVAEIFRRLPQTGLLFPRLSKMHSRHRAKEFNRRCKGLGISGVTLHSYRYAWAERAKQAGYPERFAQLALGHTSKAVHNAYAKKAQVRLPSLEDYEAEAADSNIIQVKFAS